VADLGYGLSDLAIRALDVIHATSGLPWWATIVATTFAVRTMLLPITVTSVRHLRAFFLLHHHGLTTDDPLDGMQLRNSEKMKAFQPEMEKLKEEMESAPVRSPESMVEFRKKYKALMAKHGVNPIVGVLTPLSQIPLFLGFFWGLQEISKYFPDYATGGNFWFPDLSVADPTYALPVISSALMIASIEVRSPHRCLSEYSTD
jgi:YidC/Oxa1 family membrane protein insertase